MEDFYYHDEDDFNETYDYNYEFSICDKEAVRHFSSIFLPVIYALTLAVGLFGNAMVVMVYTSPQRLRTLTDMCILNLAISDLLLLFTLPFWAADAVHGWRLGIAACKLNTFLYGANFSCGMLLLACISVDRYCAVARNATGRTGSGPPTKKKWILVCAVLWAIAVLLGLPDLIFSTVRHKSHKPVCMAIYPHNIARSAKAALELLEVILRFVLPFLVMVVCYSLVGWALCRASGVCRDRKCRALRVLLVVVAVFVLTQLPYNVVKLYYAMDIIYLLVTDCEVSKGLDWAVQVTESLALAHACINPILYACIGSSFKGNVIKAAKRLGQRFGGRQRYVNEEPAVEIALKGPANTHSQSASDQDQDTSTFTI
ncbi:atypical chemokine receptor 4b [Myripristis murdjan]|uniref:Atypical chemokine receptor 4b n=1 Tax=Myripristis murdjan TaxID=586833 RepID=A0A667YS71_9TELE|nr:atypical chemokine receptor 4 [Myripristis murdjan]XP_029934596.1 atypical chemokine receptor 4 [Myripristis murdjan]